MSLKEGSNDILKKWLKNFFPHGYVKLSPSVALENPDLNLAWMCVCKFQLNLYKIPLAIFKDAQSAVD